MKQIHGKVTFVTEKNGRLTSTQARGYDGKAWMESLLVYYGIFYSEAALTKVYTHALKRLRENEKAKARKRRRVKK